MAAAGAMILPQLAQGETPNLSSRLPHDRWPGRLIVDGKTLDDFIAISEEPSPDAAWTIRVFQSVSVPELQIRAQWRSIGAVTEWIPTLVNNAPKSSGKVTEVRSLATSWQTRSAVSFYGNNGSRVRLDDFAERIEHDVDLIELVPRGGRSSYDILPFFALTDGYDSFAVGIGWSGRWCATIRHTTGILTTKGPLSVEVGLPNVGFVLRPWESVRLPSILLAHAPGASADQARRLVRAHLTHHVVPRTPDGKSPNFTTHCTFFTGNPVMNEKIELEALERAAAIGIETYWVDAGWFGNTTNWGEEVGNWNVRRSDFPGGLRAISDRAHELGMKFTFWMEPERAVENSEWARAHPDLFLSHPDDNNPDIWRNGLVLNLGDPRAVDLAFEKISSLITEFNADVYRQDFNTSPLYAWYAADAPDRVGITEIRHIEGLYALWDRILAAHPGIMIDNCASGGMRLDLEAMRRSVPLWRSDTAYVHEQGLQKLSITSQVQGWGLGHWFPDYSGAVVTFDAYATRSSLSTGLVVCLAPPKDVHAPEYADACAAIAENKRLRPLLGEERIGLIAPDLQKEAWAAFQHHCHADGSGILVALRGPEADADSVTLRPEHIDVRGTYQVTRWDDYHKAAPTRIAGAELKEILVTIPKTRSSVLVEYQRI